MQTNFGEELKRWRGLRRISQLDLGLGADVSARHISFLETGRSNPSRSMVIHLCEELDIPREDRNRMLMAAGFSSAYTKRPSNEADLEPVREALTWILQNHDPYPAMVLDRHWRLIDANRTGRLMLDAFGIRDGQSLPEEMAVREDLQAAIANLSEVAHHLRKRLRIESEYLGGDTKLDAVADRLEALVADDFAAGSAPLPAFVPTRYLYQGLELSLLSTFSQFGTAEDIALADLRIEMMFPADKQTRDFLLALAQ